jgi:hypothetical protein
MSKDREATEFGPDGLDDLEDEEFFSQGTKPDPVRTGARPSGQLKNRRRRSLIMFGVFVILTGVLLWLLKDDLLYFFAPGQPEVLGQAEELNDDPLPHNAHVKISGVATDMCIRADLLFKRVRYLYFLGSQMGARILIESADNQQGCSGAEERDFQGRLLNIQQNDHYAAVLAYYQKNFRFSPQGGSFYVLQHDVLPGSVWPYLVAIVVLIGLALVSFIAVLRKPNH